jgi:DNA polymerase
MNEILGVDIETCSGLDIKNGAWAYSQHPSTEVYCVVFSFAKKPGNYQYITWEPGLDLPPKVIRHIRSGGKVLAHNVGFEKSIFANILSNYGFPLPRREQWEDTQALGNALNLPASLGGLAAILGCEVQKDTEAASVMRAMAKLKLVDGECGEWVCSADTPENRAILYEYCRKDVGAMLDAYFAMAKSPLSDMEHRVWMLDQKINERGVFLDQEFASKCASIAKARSEELADEAFEITSGQMINSTNSPQLKTWLEAKRVELPLVARKKKITKPDGTTGYVAAKSPSANRQTIEELLGTELPEDVRRLFNNRIEANKVASLSKLQRVPTMVGFDGRLRFSLNYNGTSTGRWIAYGLQIQNMPKVKLSQSLFELVREIITDESLEGLKMVTDRPLEAISQCLRSIVSAPEGKELIAADFSSIEARGVAWYAGQEDVLAWLHAGKDVYVETANSIESDNRQLGKVCTLALGFGMGPLKFHAEAAKYGIALELKEARRIQRAWRNNNDRIVEFWHNLENATRKAIVEHGKIQSVGPLRIWCTSGCLLVRLPSGRVMRYWKPSIKRLERTIKTVDECGEIVDMKMMVDEIRYMTVSKNKTTMQLDTLYGGKIADHVTQALARDLLALAVERVEEIDPYEVVIHVHDSVGAEVPKGQGSVEQFCAVMNQVPDWAEGMPVATEGYRDRYFRG